jgi:hypothetical protein
MVVSFMIHHHYNVTDSRLPKDVMNVVSRISFFSLSVDPLTRLLSLDVYRAVR